MLGDRDGHYRKLLDLVTCRLTNAHTVSLGEDMPAVARGRPMLDDLVDRPRRQQRPAPALMAGLRALLASRPVLRTLGRRARWIAARRLRRVPRRPPDTPLEPLDPLVL